MPVWTVLRLSISQESQRNKSEQLTTIDRRKIISKLGHISEDSEVMKLVDRAVAKQLNLKIS